MRVILSKYGATVSKCEETKMYLFEDIFERVEFPFGSNAFLAWQEAEDYFDRSVKAFAYAEKMVKHLKLRPTGVSYEEYRAEFYLNEISAGERETL